MSETQEKEQTIQKNEIKVENKENKNINNAKTNIKLGQKHPEEHKIDTSKLLTHKQECLDYVKVLKVRTNTAQINHTEKEKQIKYNYTSTKDMDMLLLSFRKEQEAKFISQVRSIPQRFYSPQRQQILKEQIKTNIEEKIKDDLMKPTSDEDSETQLAKFPLNNKEFQGRLENLNQQKQKYYVTCLSTNTKYNRCDFQDDQNQQIISDNKLNQKNNFNSISFGEKNSKNIVSKNQNLSSQVQRYSYMSKNNKDYENSYDISSNFNYFGNNSQYGNQQQQQQQQNIQQNTVFTDNSQQKSAQNVKKIVTFSNDNNQYQNNTFLKSVSLPKLQKNKIKDQKLLENKLKSQNDFYRQIHNMQKNSFLNNRQNQEHNMINNSINSNNIKKKQEKINQNNEEIIYYESQYENCVNKYWKNIKNQENNEQNCEDQQQNFKKIYKKHVYPFKTINNPRSLSPQLKRYQIISKQNN